MPLWTFLPYPSKFKLSCYFFWDLNSQVNYICISILEEQELPGMIIHKKVHRKFITFFFLSFVDICVMSLSKLQTLLSPDLSQVFLKFSVVSFLIQWFNAINCDIFFFFLIKRFCYWEISRALLTLQLTCLFFSVQMSSAFHNMQTSIMNTVVIS